jgi:hypothetical protein
MEELVKQLVSYHNVPCYLVDSKLETQLNAYGEKVNIPVVRVVGFFEDTIGKVTQLLNNEFDLRVIQDERTPDSFTSAGQTFQAGLKANRLDLPEYKILGPHKFEIRVSSILQDVYTAMQKGLSNGNATLPENVRRDFYRVGAFLEMADIEFIKIRDNAAHSAPQPAAVVPPIPTVARDLHSAPTQPYTPPAPQPEPQPVAQAPVIESVPAPAEAGKNNLTSMDMSVDSFNALAMDVNNIENKNGVEDKYLDLFSPEVETPATEAPAAKAEAATPEAVALNIDNIETFNMNVNGIIDRPVDAPVVPPTPTKPAGFEPPLNMDENAQMTEASLKEFVRTSPMVKEVDAMIAERAGAKINEEIDIEGDVDRLRFLKVFTLKQLTEKITDNKEDIVAFAEKWIGKDNGGSFDSGICLFYLEYLIVGKKNDPAFAVEYVLKFISDNDYSARYIIPTYNSIRQGEAANSFAHLTLK